MSRKLTDAEIDDLRLKHSGMRADGRSRLLLVLDVLLKFTDEVDGVTANEIARAIEACLGSRPSENTVRGDLYALAKERPFGLELAIPEQGQNTGFRCVSRPLTSDEAIMLHDMVRTSKFVGEQQRGSLCEKLLELASGRRRDEALETAYIDEREGYGAENVFDAVKAASKAIKENRKLRYYYSRHWMNGAEAETGPHYDDPVAIVVSNGQYYLETFAPLHNGEKVVQFKRMSHMRKVMVSDRPVDDVPLIDQLQRNTPSDVHQRIDMLGDGVPRTLFLKVAGNYAGRVYDRFGHDINFQYIDERDSKNVVGYACIRVQLSQTFYRWLFGMGEGVSLYRPVSKHWASRFPGISVEGDSYLRMQDDYIEAVARYREMLRRESEKYPC